MPRKKKVERDSQRFPIDNGVVVVVEFDVAKRPKMTYVDGVVIVGDHQCAPVTTVFTPFQQPVALPQMGPASERPPLRNIEVDEEDPDYKAFKERMYQKHGPPAPPDLSPAVITNDDISAEFQRRVKSETGIDISLPDAKGLVAASG